VTDLTVAQKLLAARPARQRPLDPQAALIDMMTAQQVLDALGPSWRRMSRVDRIAYAYPGRRLPAHLATAVVTVGRRWWEASP